MSVGIPEAAARATQSLEDGVRGGFVGLLHGLPQVFLQVGAQGQGLIEVQRGGQFGLSTAGIKTFRGLQEQPTPALEHLL
jgi:hypothetical protein